MNITFWPSGIVITGIAICMSGLSCRKPDDPGGRARYTAEFLSEQLRRPMNIGGPSNQTDFVQHVYVPAVDRAQHSIDKLKQGELDVIPVAAYVRPRELDCLLWLMWLQRDDGQRTVVLRDKDGVFATFAEPTPGNEYAHSANYVRFDTVTINLAPSNHVPAADELPVIHAQRPFDSSSVSVSFNRGGNESLSPADHISAPLYLLPKKEPSPSTAGSPR